MMASSYTRDVGITERESRHMPTQDERITTLEFNLNQFKPETIKAYTDMAYELTIVKGLGEDSIKRLAAFRNEMNEFRAETAEHLNRMDTRLDDIISQLALVLQKLDEGKS